VAEDLVHEIQSVQNRMGELLENVNNKALVEEGLLSACSSLLDAYYQLQASNNGGHLQRELEHDDKASILDRALLITRNSQRALRDIKPRYDAIVESENLYYCRLNPSGQFIFANQAFSRCLNVSPDNIYQSNFYESLNEADANDLRVITSEIGDQSLEFTRILAWHTPNGRMDWQQWHFRRFFDSAGELLEIQAVGHDVTAFKQAEMAADQHNRELSALHTATRALLTTLDIEPLLGQILDATVGALPMAQKGTLHLIARDTGQLELRASIGYADPRIKKFSYSESSGYVARAVRERTPLIFRETRDEIPTPRGALIPEMNLIRSAVVAPLILKDRILGAISLESGAPSAFNDSDLRLLVSIAATATNAIQNAELHAEVQKLAITDALTGLYNRRGFIELGEREIERSFRFKRPLTAIMLDVDHLKAINDRYGHFTGDRVLHSIAVQCSKQLRKVDIVGRYGGDEFVVLLPETHLRLGSLVGERLRRSVQDVHIPGENELLQVSISLGLAGLTTEDTNLETLIHRADAAMYAAKENGRNQVIPISDLG
jgi:diguanylate cyclase (GGDEF)-like protein/PAS domain S-box-containing protein